MDGCCVNTRAASGPVNISREYGAIYFSCGADRLPVDSSDSIAESTRGLLGAQGTPRLTLSNYFVVAYLMH
jgi:hypothetical protein